MRPEDAEVRVLAEYFPVLLFMVVTAGVGIALIAIGNVLGPKKPSAEKDAPYECGFEAFEDARMKFDVRYYLIAILFIIFDLEIAFVLPWATVFSKLGTVKVVPPPVPLPPFALRQHWHSRFNADPANVWLRHLIKETFERYPDVSEQ